MKFQILTLLVTALAAVANAAESTPTSQTIKPTAEIPVPPGVVCAMSVCPSTTAVVSKRDIPCPSYCENGCEVINDICCPGQMKAVCNSNSTASGSAGLPSNSGSSAKPTSAPVPSNKPSASANPSAASPSAPSAASTLNIASILSTFMLAALLTVGLNQL